MLGRFAAWSRLLKTLAAHARMSATPRGSRRSARTKRQRFVPDFELLESRQLLTTTVSIYANYGAHEQDEQAGLFTVYRDDTNGDLEVFYTVATGAGMATPGDDYQALSGSVIIPNGLSSASIDINPVDDSLYEGNEVVRIELNDGGSAYCLEPYYYFASLAITDNDDLPSVEFTAASQSDSEGAGTLTITLELSAAAGVDVVVPFTVGGTAVDPADYTIDSSPVTILAGYTSADITITLNDDSLDEHNETIVVTLGTPTNADLGATTEHTATLTDNDDPPTVQFASSSYSVLEDGGSAFIAVTLSAPSGKEIVVSYQSSDDTAASGSDYTAVDSSLTFAPGQTSKSFTVPILNDTLDEYDETVTLTLMEDPDNATLGSPTTATLTIRDDTVLTSPSAVGLFNTGLDSLGVLLDEGEVDPHYELVQSADPSYPGPEAYVPEVPTWVWMSNGPDSAWITPRTGEPTVASGDYVYRTTFDLTGHDLEDVVLRGQWTTDDDGTIFLNGVATGITSPSLGGFASFTLNSGFIEGVNTLDFLVNNGPLYDGLRVEWFESGGEVDGPPTVSFSMSDYEVSEDGVTATINVTLSAASGKTVTVDYATSNGTAESGSDYTAASGTLTFVPGDTEETFSVTILDDTEAEDNETVTLTLSAPDNADLGPVSSATLTILDDDDDRFLSFSFSDYEVDEDAGTVTITVSLSEQTDQTVTVDYATSDGSAEAGSDYAEASGTLTFEPYETEKTFTIWVTDDAAAEGDETVTLTLSNPSNGSLGNPFTATLTIHDVTPSAYLPENENGGVEPSQAYRHNFGAFAVGLQTGSLHLEHGSTQQGNPFDQDALMYFAGAIHNSDTVTPLPVVAVSVLTDAGDPVPSAIRARLTWPGIGAQDWVTFTLPPGSQPGDRYFLPLQVASPVATTNRYNWTVDVEVQFASRGPVTRQTTGALNVVVNGAAPYGHGWSMPDLNYLVIDEFSGDSLDDVLLVFGDGGSRYFEATGSGNTFVAESSDPGTLTLAGGVYTYTEQNQTKWEFNSGGQLTRVLDTRNLAVTFNYDSNRLDHVINPNGDRTTFSYSGGLLTQITKPRGHLLTFTLDNNGDLVGIADPEGGLRTFTYDNHRLTRDQFGVRDHSFSYSSGMLSTVDLGTGTSFDVTPRLLQGLDGNLAAGDPTAQVTNALENVSAFGLDNRGRVTRLATPEGREQSWEYNAQGLSVLHVDGLDRRTTLTYWADTHDLQSLTDSDGQTWTYTYDATFHQVTVAEDPLNRRTTSTYDPTTGDLLSVTNAENEETVYTWEDGLLESVTDPLGQRTTYLYNAERRLETIVDAEDHRTTFLYNPATGAYTVQNALNQLTTAIYDGLGRLQSSTTGTGEQSGTDYNEFGEVTASIDPRGNRTTFVYDDAGRPQEVLDPWGNRATTLYDVVGRVEVMIDEYDNRTTYHYDAADRQIAVEDYLGNRTTTQYDTADQVEAMIDEYGNRTTYLYDAAGRQEVVIDFLNNRTTAHYDAAGQMDYALDEYGNRTTFTYDGAGRQTAVEDYLGNRTTTGYDDAGRVEVTIDEYGNRTTYGYDVVGRQEVVEDYLGNRTTTLYDDAGRVEAVVDEYGNRTSYLYDDAGRVQEVQDYLGNRTTTLYNAYGEHETTIDVYGNRTTLLYDTYGRPETVIDVRNQRVTTVYDDVHNRVEAMVDQLNHHTTYHYDSRGRNEAVEDALGNYTTTVYDGHNRTAATIDPRGYRTTYHYDSRGRQEAVEDALNYRTTTVYGTSHNRVEAMIDALDHRTTYHYDSRGRQEAVQDAEDYRVTTVYDSHNRTEAMIDARNYRTTYHYDSRGRQESVEDALNYRVTTVYDSHNRTEAMINQRGYATTYHYDTRGRQEAVEDALNHRNTTVYDTYGRTAATVDAEGERTTFHYDAYGRQEAVEDALGNRTTTVYDVKSRVEAMVDPLNQRTTYGYDALDRRETVKDAEGGVTTTVYDANGNTINVIDPVNNQTTFVYDAVNREVERIDPLGQSSTFAYDGAGRLTSTTDRLGRRRDFEYDDVHNKTKETWLSDLSATENVLTFTYDGNRNPLTAQDYDGTYTMGYDALNRVTHVEGLFGVGLTFTYDGAGNRTVAEDSLGGTTTSTYDAVNRLTRREFADGTTELRLDFTYTDRDQQETVTRYSDLAGTTQVGSSLYTYDELRRIATIRHLDGNDDPLAEYTYTYDDGGRLDTEEINGTLKTYGYDATNQLTDDDGTTYTYDANGNRTNAGYVTDTGNRLTQDDTWTYTYDAEGNLVKKSQGEEAETWEYGYDQRNQMIWAEKRATDGGDLQMRADYAYDAWGNRIEKVVDEDGALAGGAETTHFALDGWNPAKPAPVGTENWDVWADLDLADDLQVRYVRGDVVDQLFARVDDAGDEAWYLTDRLGSVRNLADEAGDLLATYTYDGFGNVVSDSNPALGERYKFTSRELDEETGLQYSRARYYYAATARWTSEDPLGFRAGDSNLYRYVHNAPTGAVDPAGLIRRPFNLYQSPRFNMMWSVVDNPGGGTVGGSIRTLTWLNRRKGQRLPYGVDTETTVTGSPTAATSNTGIGVPPTTIGVVTLPYTGTLPGDRLGEITLYTSRIEKGTYEFTLKLTCGFERTGSFGQLGTPSGLDGDFRLWDDNTRTLRLSHSIWGHDFPKRPFSTTQVVRVTVLNEFEEIPVAKFEPALWAPAGTVGFGRVEGSIRIESIAKIYFPFGPNSPAREWTINPATWIVPEEPVDLPLHPYP